MFKKVREGIWNTARKAGESIRDFDTAYAQKIQDGDAHAVVKLTAGVPLFHPYEGIKGPVEQMAATGLKASSAAARYALPAAGVTLAGKGLYDLTQMMLDQQTSGTLDPQ